ncbi:hypothetical protein Pst134EA_025597 [Puccinia striiformis f. sp. tritici]|uniref:hypothetical protein n=1 Tax=Puccinia striiformis f. sp. tritici TaxID=168172 RepID=UPI0020088DE2|nr:hypothetical protein Pst134EA_025597 [Puccinia striiformis f. sp. tritici]KAH9451654.1 hypothetical protein Pst134EA_025597 [Puccinia striiformis f. sp. tritici]
MIVAHLRDSAEAFWFNLASELDVNEMSWSLSKRLLRIKVLGDKCDTIDDHCKPLPEHDRLAKSGYCRGNASKARCYNCNKIGHLSKDCPSPRKNKYNNSKISDRGRFKNTLNFIDLEPEETPQGLFLIEPLDSGPNPWDKINDNFKQISDNLTKCFNKTIVNLNQRLWSEAEREVESHAVCKKIESTLSVLNPKALEFIPGASRHGLIKELELNYIGEDLCLQNLKRKHTDSVDLTRKRLKNSDAESITRQ